MVEGLDVLKSGGEIRGSGLVENVIDPLKDYIKSGNAIPRDTGWREAYEDAASLVESDATYSKNKGKTVNFTEKRGPSEQNEFYQALIRLSQSGAKLAP